VAHVQPLHVASDSAPAPERKPCIFTQLCGSGASKKNDAASASVSEHSNRRCVSSFFLPILVLNYQLKNNILKKYCTDYNKG
jgi:hypothetical protein